MTIMKLFTRFNSKALQAYLIDPPRVSFTSPLPFSRIATFKTDKVLNSVTSNIIYLFCVPGFVARCWRQTGLGIDLVLKIPDTSILRLLDRITHLTHLESVIAFTILVRFPP
jgi:hypothetical protein